MRYSGWLRPVALYLALSLALAACQRSVEPGGNAETPGPTDGGDAGEPPAGFQLAKADVPRNTTPTVDPTDLGALASGNTQFAFDLYHAVAPEQAGENLIYSPFSISLAFAMVYAGARGQTEQEIANTLHYALPQDRLHPAFNTLDLELTGLSEEAPDAPESGELTLRIANSLWGQTGFNFEQAFLETIAANYGAGLRLVDFVGAPEPSRQAINGWVEDETEDRIKDLIPQDAITPNTRLVLANAIYFYGGWTMPFQEGGTQDAPFTLLDGAQVSAPMMRQGGSQFLYTAGDGYQAVELPYGAYENAAMLIILPDSARFDEIEAGLDAVMLDEIIGSLHPVAVTELTMPRFEFETSLALVDTLKAMGMVAPFEAADFSGISTEAALAITAVLHKANITVDEEGTEAAAATAIIVEEAAAMPPEEEVTLHLDRPFIFAIYDRATGTILFLGRVLNPAG